jgi:hypothetical protein
VGWGYRNGVGRAYRLSVGQSGEVSDIANLGIPDPYSADRADVISIATDVNASGSMPRLVDAVHDVGLEALVRLDAQLHREPAIVFGGWADATRVHASIAFVRRLIERLELFLDLGKSLNHFAGNFEARVPALGSVGFLRGAVALLDYGR